MRVRFLYATFLLLILSPLAIPADEQESSISQRGITTKNNLEDSRETSPGNIGVPVSQVQDQIALPSVTKEGKKETIEKIGVVPVKPAESAAGIKGDGDKPQKSSSTAHQNRRWLIRTPPPDSKQVKRAPVKPMEWKSDTQKNQCEDDLEKLSGAFIKARYYSIQGDSCACAENADQYLILHEKIRQACPDNYLHHEGYNSRITRNMDWLKSLGEKRCMGTSAVSRGQSKQKTDQHLDTTPKDSHNQMDNTPQPTGNPSEHTLVTPLKE